MASGALSGLNFRRHNSVSTLYVEDDLAALAMLHNNTHTLRFRGEGEVLQDVILFIVMVWIYKLDVELLSLDELHVELFSELDQSDLIWARSLELLLFGVISIWVDRCYVMTEGKS